MPLNYKYLERLYIIKQIITETTEPAAVAMPIGNRVEGNIADARYASGTRAQVIEAMLRKNE